MYETFEYLRIIIVSEDKRCGSRICKLASIMCRDHHFLPHVIRVGPGHRPSMSAAIKKLPLLGACERMSTGELASEASVACRCTLHRLKEATGSRPSR